MVNTSGINGHGQKIYPPDEELSASLRKYALLGLTQSQKLARLIVDHHLSIGKSTLNSHERRLNIPSVKRSVLSSEEITQLVVDEVDKDVTQNNGPNYFKGKLQGHGIKIPRDTIRTIMREHYPEGAEKRYPGKKKLRVNRSPLSALGPFHEVAGDGHEKIGALALQMGGLGLPIYAYRDKWGGMVLLCDVIPDCRSPGAVGYLYLDLVEKLGGFPMQLNLDKGSEIGWQVAFQVILREFLAPQIDPEVYPPVALLKSVHNIVIESLWRWLREKTGYNLREVLLHGKVNHLIKTDIDYHRHLFYWIFVPIVQASLDEFRMWWNQRRVRWQADKDMPSGHVPDDATEHPEFYGGINCLIPAPIQAIDDLRTLLYEEFGPREKFRTFFPPNFGPVAADVLIAIGDPEISLLSAWDIFTRMSDYIENMSMY